MNIKRDFLWIILFGSLIGLNETLLSSMHFPFKSVILCVITLLVLSVGRYQFPMIGSSLIIINVAVLYKIIIQGIHSNKLQSMEMLGIAFEVLALFIINQRSVRFINYSIVSFVAALFTYAIFALMQRYFYNSEHWNSLKFNDYIFIKGPIAAVVSASISFLGVMAVKPMIAWYNKVLVKNPYAVHGILGLLIVVFWFLGYVTA